MKKIIIRFDFNIHQIMIGLFWMIYHDEITLNIYFPFIEFEIRVKRKIKK